MKCINYIRIILNIRSIFLLQNYMKMAHNNGNLLQQRYNPFLKSYEQPLHPHLIEVRNPSNFSSTRNSVLSALMGLKGNVNKNLVSI